jgi:hypothetical protein
MSNLCILLIINGILYLQKKDRVVMQQLALASSRAIQQMFGVMVLLFVGENGTLEQ